MAARFVVAVLGVACAAAHDFQICHPPALPVNLSASSSAAVVNPGLNLVNVLVCTAQPPSEENCGSAASPFIYACPGVTFTGNATSYLNLTVAATAIVYEYHTVSPFSFHPVKSISPLPTAQWPGPRGSFYVTTIPYPNNGTGVLLCDENADCPGGATCVGSPTPPRCGPVPSPLPSPSPPPLPPPARPPPAAACNITGRWEQHNLTTAAAALPEIPADAFITISPASAGVYDFQCVSSHWLCPGGVSGTLNGSISLSESDSTMTLTPFSGPALAGVVNNTYSCGIMSVFWDGYGVEWKSDNPAPPPVLNLNVSLATYLSPGAAHAIVPTGVAILAPAPVPKGPVIVAVAGNGDPEYPGVAVETLLNATPSSNGTIVVLSLSESGAAAVVRIVKVGLRIDHIRASATGDVAVAGDFGVAVVSGLAPGAAPAVAWHDALGDIIPGSCGVCCRLGGSSNTTCRVDIGGDGVVAVSLAAADLDGGLLWAAYSSSGVRTLSRVVSDAAEVRAVFVDAARAQLGVTYFYNSNTGKEPMVMPRVEYFSYEAPGSAAPPTFLYSDFPWSAAVYRQPGPCDGNVADGRIMDLRVGRDGSMLLAGRSDGGNSPFACNLRNVSVPTTLVSLDEYTSPYNMGSQAITNLVRANASGGEAIVGQQQLVRLTNTKGNTLLTTAVHADASGFVYELQSAGYALPNMANLTINGLPLNGPSDTTALLVLSPDFNRREHWTGFLAPGAPGDAGGPVDIDVRGGAAAFVLTSGSESVQVGALPGTGPTGRGGPLVGYLVVMPTLG